MSTPLACKIIIIIILLTVFLLEVVGHCGVVLSCQPVPMRLLFTLHGFQSFVLLIIGVSSYSWSMSSLYLLLLSYLLFGCFDCQASLESLPSYMKPCPRQSDLKRRRQSLCLQLPEGNFMTILFCARQRRSLYGRLKSLYLVEILEHGGELSARRAPVGREVVEHQVLGQKKCNVDVLSRHGP